MLLSQFGLHVVSWIAVGMTILAVGCGRQSAQQPTVSAQPQTDQPADPVPRRDNSPIELNPPQRAGDPSAEGAGIGPRGPGWRYRHPDEGRSLADLLDRANPEPADTADRPGDAVARPQINESLVASAGIRKLAGKHVTIYTDLAADPDVDQLPEVFDLAVPQWRRYFQLDADAIAKWHMTGYVMKDPERFRSTGLLPDDLPNFLHGYQRDGEFWVYEQKSAYYRRHLVLHEGTHAVMNNLLGSTGPSWYMEGIAELLGTHRWADGQLELRNFPGSRDEVPYWGRVKIVREQRDQGRAKSLSQIMAYEPGHYLQVEPYGWSWAAATLLDAHPDYREQFRQLPRMAGDPQFTARFQAQLRDRWRELSEQWQLFVMNMEYGYDVEREAVEFRSGQPLEEGQRTVKIAADRGWQSTGVELLSNSTYQITASGRFQLAQTPKIWWCEPNGVTIRYHDGRPLGQLLAALRSDPPGEGLTALAKPVPIGLERSITLSQPGTLYLRINDSPAELADNVGSLTVTIRMDR